TEFNIEGNCQEQKFVELVLANKPAQVTLVPDALGQLTSNHGWHTIKNKTYLQEMVKVFKDEGIRVSIFVESVEDMVGAAGETGTVRIDLITRGYAAECGFDKEKAHEPYFKAAVKAREVGPGLNTGHDLDLNNLSYFKQKIPDLMDVSIG